LYSEMMYPCRCYRVYLNMVPLNSYRTTCQFFVNERDPKKIANEQKSDTVEITVWVCPTLDLRTILTSSHWQTPSYSSMSN
jgi:hypothetical protein